MLTYLPTLIIGAVCIILGFVNRTGNISSLHSYHRHRVSEEDRLAFGKEVGLGTIIIGISITLFGAMSAVAYYTGLTVLILVGTGIFAAGLIAGIIITFRAMKKYNKGIF